MPKPQKQHERLVKVANKILFHPVELTIVDKLMGFLDDLGIDADEDDIREDVVDTSEKVMDAIGDAIGDAIKSSKKVKK